MRSTIVDALSSVDAGQWDRLASGNLYQSHGWLTWLEPSTSATARYVIVTGSDGELLAAAPYYVVERERNEFYRLDVLGLQPDNGRVLMGARNGYRNGVLAGDAESRRDAVRLVVDRIHEEAGGGWWLYVTDDAVAELCEILDRVPIFLELEGRIPLPGNGWEDYLDSLPASRRHAVRRERRAFEKAGYAIGTARLDECWYEAGPLLANVQNRYGHGDSPDDARGYLASLGRAANPGAVTLCRRDDRLVGYCHYYDFGTTRWIRTFGLDYPALTGAFEYFELAYYRQVAGAYAAGLRSVHCGIKSPQAKAVRGARLHPLWAVPVGEAAASWPARRCRAHNRAALEATRDMLAHACGAVDETRWACYA